MDLAKNVSGHFCDIPWKEKCPRVRSFQVRGNVIAC